jgi:uncharacterized protein (TIGR04255 family)
MTLTERDQDTQLNDPVSFDAPPVAEMVLGLQFSGPVLSEVETLADFWPRIREEFPEVEKRPALPRINEQFGPEAAISSFELSLGGEPSRYCFTSADQRWMVQVQPDRLVLNWRKADENDVYPRYRSVRTRFLRIYKAFVESVGEERVVGNPPDWCATTYVNNILANNPRSPNGRMPLNRIVRLFAAPKSNVLPTLEETTFQQKYLLDPLVAGGEPRGRLYVSASPALRAVDQLPGYSLELRVLSQPEAQSRAAVTRCFDQSRELIVRSFKDITTPAMHEAWGLQGED